MNDETQHKVRWEAWLKWSSQWTNLRPVFAEEFMAGHEAGYALAKSEQDEALRVAVEALEYYVNRDSDAYLQINRVATKALAEIRKLQKGD